MTQLILYQAGAGSGKTYTITRELVERLASGAVRPDRLVATTFTRKAAAELKDRIQQRLLHPEPGDPPIPLERRLELAAALGHAMVGTVHSVGHQMLSRYALHTGLSPQLEPLEEKAQERHLRRILAEMPPEGLAELDRLAGRLGEDKPQELVLRILDAKRGNAIPDDAFRASMAQGTERLIAVLGGGASVALPDFPEFYRLCQAVHDKVAANGDATKATAEALDKLLGVVRADRERWQVWGQVASLKWAKKSESDALDLMAVARRANVHAGLHADLRAYTACLVERALELQERYWAYKQGRGLVDFTDLEERFLHLLQDPAVRKDLQLDLVVVDEFQDTNPIQLAIFQSLAGLAGTCLWVGDRKQAIYGFRGTDAELMEDVLRSDPELLDQALGTVPTKMRRTLDSNYRSTPGLVECVNRIFAPIFGDGTALKAVRTGPARIERWQLQGKNRDLRQQAFVNQVGKLLLDVDAGDVAILVRKNEDAANLAAALRQAGVPVLVQTPGLLATREGAMVLAGLRLVADDRDSLAAATLCHIDDVAETPAWFQGRVSDPKAPITGPLVEAIAGLDARIMPPSGVAAAVLQALRLPDRIASWGNPQGRAANLDALVGLAKAYEEEAENSGKAATLTGLVYWLEDLRTKGQDFLPVPAGISALRILTLWAAKGLEWPCVILLQDGSPPEAHPFRIRATGGDAAHGKPLDGRRLTYWPYPFGMNFYGGLNADGCGVQDAAIQSPEGQSLQAAQDEETRRLMYVGFTRAKTTLILAEGGKNPLAQLPELDAVLPLDGRPAAVGGVDYKVVECSDVSPPSPGGPEPVAWFEPARGPAVHAARYWSPSDAPAMPATAQATALPGAHPFPGLDIVDRQALGLAVHAYLGALPALRGAADAVKVEHARLALRRWACEGVIEPAALVAAGRRLEQWVEAALPGATWHCELPLSGPRAEGGQWVGTADLVVESAGKSLVIDHKSADRGETGWAHKAAEYGGQLAVYVRLATDGKGGAFVHLPLGGGMAELKLG